MRAFAAILVSVVALSCASRPPVVSTYPLLNETVRTADGALSARIPEGWASASGDTLPPGVAAWLVNDDRSGMIALRELLLDRLTARRAREEGMGFVARLSLAFRRDSAGSGEGVEIAEYLLRDMTVSGYELSSGGEWRSVIVVSLAGRYYECEAASTVRSESASRRISEAQKSFVASLATSIRE